MCSRNYFPWRFAFKLPSSYFELFSQCPSLSSCISGVSRLQVSCFGMCRLQVVFTECLAFELDFSVVSLSLQFLGVFHILLSIQFYSVCGLRVFMACVAFKLFSWRLPPSSHQLSGIRRFQTCLYNMYCPQFLIVCCVCRYSVSSAFIGHIPLRLVLWYFLLPIQFSQGVSLSVYFFGIFCSYLNVIQVVVLPFLGPFFSWYVASSVHVCGTLFWSFI